MAVRKVLISKVNNDFYDILGTLDSMDCKDINDRLETLDQNFRLLYIFAWLLCINPCLDALYPCVVALYPCLITLHSCLVALHTCMVHGAYVLIVRSKNALFCVNRFFLNMKIMRNK